MKTIFKVLTSILMILLFIIPISTQFVTGQNEQIKVKEGTEGIIITTEYLTLRINGGKPHFIWWNGNQSTANEMYNVQFVSLGEFSGNDDILDHLGELSGLSYNLMTSSWSINILNEETKVTITLTLSGLANGAEVQFIVQIYNQDQSIPGTDQMVNGLTEVKFDIIIKDWVFTENTKGLALKTQILESQKRHQVRIRNGTAIEKGNVSKLQFESEAYRKSIVAYYEWASFAEIFDDEVKTSEIEVGTSYLLDNRPGQGPGVSDPGMIHQWLTYPKYGDSLTMVHDPLIGINPESFSVPLFLLPILGALLTTAIIIALKKKARIEKYSLK